MLGVQLTFNGDKLAVCNNVIVGALVDDGADDCLGVLRILGNEYAEQVRLIKLGLQENKEKLYWYLFCRVEMGELIISGKGDYVDIKPIIKDYCFPMKTDNLVISYVKCKRSYVVKQSAIYVRNELKKLRVIK